MLHVNQHVWWLETTLEEIYLGMETCLLEARSTRPMHPNSEWNKNLFALSFYSILYDSVLKRKKFVKLSFVCFYSINGHIELWMTRMKSPNHIRQKCITSALFKKQGSICTMDISFNSQDTLHNYKHLFTYKCNIKYWRNLTNVHRK